MVNVFTKDPPYAVESTHPILFGGGPRAQWSVRSFDCVFFLGEFCSSLERSFVEPYDLEAPL